MMDTVSQGQCINLGFDYDEFTQEIIDTYTTLPSVEKYGHWADHALYQRTIDSIVANCKKTLLVSRTSHFYPYLKEHVEKGHVACYEDITAVFTLKNTLVFMDDDEIYTGAIGEFVQLQTIPDLPSWIISNQKIITIMHYLDKLLPLSKFITVLQKIEKRELVFFTMSKREYIFASLLLLLCRNCTGVVTENCYCFQFVVNTDIGYTTCAAFDNVKNACLMLNAYAVEGRERFLPWIRHETTFYFLYGEAKKQPSAQLVYTPFFLWLYPHAGTGRVYPVLETLSQLLGLNRGWGIERYRIEAFRCTTSQHSTASSQEAATVKLYDMLPENSFMYLHDYNGSLSNVLYTRNAKAIILIRDMRDRIVSFTNWCYGVSIKYRGADFEDWAMHSMKRLNEETLDLTKLYSYPNVYFLRFEDVHADPMKAYMKLFEDFGFTKDPYWVDEVIIPQLTQKILEAKIPPVLRRANEAASCREPNTKTAVPTSPTFKPDYRISNGKPGGWVNYFTPRMKEYFKENSNGILQLFGYEADDNW